MRQAAGAGRQRADRTADVNQRRSTAPRAAVVTENTTTPDDGGYVSALDHSDEDPAPTAPALSNDKEEEDDDKKERKQQKLEESDDDSDKSSSSSSSSSGSDEENSEMDEADTEIPDIKWPATLTIIAKKYSGKTNMLFNLVRPSEWDNIFAITRTKRTGNMNRIVHNKACVMTEMSDRFLEEVIRHQESFPSKKEPRTLFIFDDFRGTKWRATSSLALGQLASSGRNANISMIFSAQDPKYVPTDVRRNTEYYALGNNSLEIIDKLAKNHSTANLDKQVLKSKLMDISRVQDYRFLWMDDRERSWKQWQPDHLMES